MEKNKEKIIVVKNLTVKYGLKQQPIIKNFNLEIDCGDHLAIIGPSGCGNHCNGIRINEKLSPLSTALQNGDFIEILTSNNATPSLDWLNFVVTPTAKNRIRQWYKKSHRDETIKRGRDLLEKEVGRNGFEALLSSEAMKKVANRCNLKTTEDLLASLGFGNPI